MINRIKDRGIEIIIYEPRLKESHFLNLRVEADICSFKKNVDIILVNRIDDALYDVKDKVFTRDIFGGN